MAACNSPLLNRQLAEVMLIDDTCDDIYDLIVQNSLELKSNQGNILVVPRYEDPGMGHELTECCREMPRCKYKRSVIEGTAKKFGCQFDICEEEVLGDPIPALNVAAEMAGRQYSNRKSFTIMQHLANTISSIYAVNGNNGKNPAEFTLKDHRFVIKNLVRNCAPPFFGCIAARNLFMTAPIPETYLVIAHVDLMDDIEEAFGCKFKGTEAYISCGGANCLIKGEIGAATKARFVLNSKAPKWTDADGNTLYKMIYVGGNAVWGIRTPNFPPEVFTRDRLQSAALDCYALIWRAKLGYITVREDHILNLIVTLKEAAA